MKPTVLIFDFDGTIADTHNYLIEISNRLSQEFNYNTIRPEEIDELKNKTSQEIIRHLKVPLLKIPAIVTRAKSELHKNIDALKPIAGLKEALHQLRGLEVSLGIVSSNTRETVTKFLKAHNLDIFDFIHTTSKIWSKNISLKSLIKKKGFSKNAVIYIGDEIRDITAARKSGIKVAAVSWGYNSARALKDHQPDFMIQNPQELLNLCPHSLNSIQS